MSVNTKMTAIADKIRSLRGVSGTMGLDAMATHLGNEITGLNAALAALTEKGVTVPDGTKVDGLAALIAGVGSSPETCTVTKLSPTLPELVYTRLVDGKITSMYTNNPKSLDDIVVGSSICCPGRLNVALGGNYEKLVTLYGLQAYMIKGDCTISFNPCLAKDTLISLSDGTTKAVQDIEYSDMLLVWDFDHGCFTAARPVWIKEAQTTSYYYRCSFSDGTELKLIGSDGKCHRLLDVEKGSFESATDCVGKRVMTRNGEVVLENCERVDEEIEFFNVITHTHINLYAENVLTSCRLNNLYPIVDMMFVKKGREKKSRDNFAGIGSDMFRGLRIAEQPMSSEEINAYVSRLYALMDWKTKYYLTINNESVVMDEKEYFAHFGEDDIRQYVSNIYHAQISIDDVPEDMQKRVIDVVNKRMERFGAAEQNISDTEALNIILGGDDK